MVRTDVTLATFGSSGKAKSLETVLVRVSFSFPGKQRGGWILPHFGFVLHQGLNVFVLKKIVILSMYICALTEAS